MTDHPNLLAQPTRLPDDPAQSELAAGVEAAVVAARYPAFSSGWAQLAEQALSAGDAVAAYAYARTGYHRGLDALRRAGWKGSGPVPWSHEGNRGFLRALFVLGRAAAAIEETGEAQRCEVFLRDCDPTAEAELAGGT
jgi:hypothetical protein